MSRLHGMTTFALSCLFMIVFAIALAAKNINAGLEQWAQPRVWTVNIAQSADNTDLYREPIQQRLQKELQQNSEIENVRFVSQKAFIESFQQNWASLGADLLKDPEVLQFVPDSFDITVKSESPEQLKTKILSYDGVVSIDAGEDWRGKYIQVSKVLNQFSMAFLLIISLGAFFIISYVIQGSVQKKQKEIEVLELVGATAHDIRKPFLIEGAALGFVSAMLSLILTYGLLLALKEAVPVTPLLSNLISSVSFFNAIEVLCILALTSLLGGASSYVYVRQVNTGWASSKKIGSAR
jgi:cell division transport system permease protein